MNKENTVLTLDDHKQYVVVKQFNLENKDYIFLADLEDENNVMFGQINGNNIEKVTDPLLLGKLALKYTEVDR